MWGDKQKPGHDVMCVQRAVKCDWPDLTAKRLYRWDGGVYGYFVLHGEAARTRFVLDRMLIVSVTDTAFQPPALATYEAITLCEPLAETHRIVHSSS